MLSNTALAPAAKRCYQRHVTKRLLIALGIALVAALTLFLFSQRAVTVQVSQQEHDVPITVFGLGTVEARVISEVGFEVGATLIELKADHGDHVSKDSVLARLHSAEQEARVAKAEAGVINAEAALTMTRAVVSKARAVLAQRQQTNRRQQRLLIQNTTSKESAEDAQLQQDVAKADLAVASSEVEVANARVADARAQLDYDEVLLDHHVLRSPYDAVVVKRRHELGSVVTAGEPLFTLMDTESVWVLAYVDESQAGAIRVDQAAEVRLRSLPQTVFAGHVARIEIESDRVTEERRVYVVCDQCPVNFHLGEQAEVFITTNHLKEATLIPAVAVADFDGTAGKIWAVSDHRLQRLAVQFGARTLDGRLAIAGGLADGTLPVTSLRSGFREGRRVKVATEESP